MLPLAGFHLSAHASSANVQANRHAIHGQSLVLDVRAKASIRASL